MKASTRHTAHLPQPLAQYFVALAGGLSDPPKSVISLWPMLGYTPKRGVRDQKENQKRWEQIFVNAPHFEEWVRSRDGLRAPRRWPQAIEDVFYSLNVHVPPIEFARACFPSQQRAATLYTPWRGMPELFAVAHGWEVEQQELALAVDAARRLSTHVPYVVFARGTSLLGVPYPSNSPSFMSCVEARSRLLSDPLRCQPYVVERAVDTKLWPATVIAGLPVREGWRRPSSKTPVERSLVEAGAKGWKPVSS